MSLKRKYSHEPDDGAKEEVGSQQGSDAVSKSFPMNFFLFQSSAVLRCHILPTDPSPTHSVLAVLIPSRIWLMVTFDG